MHDGLLAWDASWYTDIVPHGYRALPEEALRFFPGFPLLGRTLGLVTGDGVALVVIANVAGLAAALLVYRLVRWERGDAALATRAAWLLSIVPPALVFVMGYTDALAIAAISSVPRRSTRPLVVAVAAALLVGVVRPTGFLLKVPLAVEAYADW